MSKKVLGINWGRDKGMNRLCLKKALEAAEAEGCETKLINTEKLKIGRCLDCGGRASESGCCVKDDYQTLRDAVMEADAIICSCPTYALTVVGQYKSFTDRLWSEKLHNSPGFNCHAVICYIAIGGAQDDHWVSLNLPMMKLLGFALGCPVADELSIHGKAPDLDRIAGMARNAVEACGQTAGQIQFKGDDKGVCPVCHSGFISLTTGQGMKAQCPICGAEGDFEIVNDEIRVNFAAGQRERFSL